MSDVTRIFDILLNHSPHNDDAGFLFHSKIDGAWVGMTRQEYKDSVLHLACSLQKLGLQKGDRVATILKNRPEWNLADMALLMSGMIQVPLYPTLTLADYVFILKEAGVRAIFSDDEELFINLQEYSEDLPRLRHRILVGAGMGIQCFSDVVCTPTTLDVEALISNADGISPEDTCTIIYTSGTTGTPKGVMLSHRNIVSNFMAVVPISGLDHKDIALSALPLCHVYERMLNYAYQYLGMKIYYAESLLTISDNLREVSPTIFCAVPRILEKMYDRILSAGRNRKGAVRCLYLRALKYALSYDPSQAQRNRISVRHYLFDRMVFRRWRMALGSSLRIIVSGGAPLQPRLARLFWAGGIKVTEGYGLTETSPVIAVNHPEPEDMRIGTVGPLLPGVEVKFAEDGEILCRGPNVMQGYYLNPDLTQQTIEPDGWLHTGDIGCMVEDRFLKITDRKKEMFKTSGGKYIAPQVIENRFKESSFFEHVMVVGDNRKFPAALIIPSFDYLRSWCEVKGLKYPGDEAAVHDPLINERIGREIESINQGLSKTEQIKRYALLHDQWTTENGALSPTLKLRRTFLKQKYLRQILMLYSDESGDN